MELLSHPADDEIVAVIVAGVLTRGIVAGVARSGAGSGSSGHTKAWLGTFGSTLVLHFSRRIFGGALRPLCAVLVLRRLSRSGGLLRHSRRARKYCQSADNCQISDHRDFLLLPPPSDNAPGEPGVSGLQSFSIIASTQRAAAAINR